MDLVKELAQLSLLEADMPALALGECPALARKLEVQLREFIDAPTSQANGGA